MPATPQAPSPAPKLWLHHLADEADAAYLYKELARGEPDPKRSALYTRLSEVENRHVGVWQKLLAENGHTVPTIRVSVKARTMAWLARRFGPAWLLPMLLEEEGQEVKSYLQLYKAAPEGATGPAALRLARESAEHAETLGKIAGTEGEPWHKTQAGGFLRNVVYGFNDGLTANFGLVAGMVGAATSMGTAGHAVVVAGLAGVVADALSMSSSGYLAAKSEREVYEHEIAMEREEIRLMPELETEELSLLYQAKGIPEGQSDELARQVMSDPEKALEEKVREELKIGDASSTPFREAWVTGLATAIGAFIPVAPLLFSTEPWALYTSFTIAMLSHFGVGAARSFFTGRGVVRSGIDMLVVGFGVAVAGYFVGDWIVKLL